MNKNEVLVTGTESSSDLQQDVFNTILRVTRNLNTETFLSMVAGQYRRSITELKGLEDMLEDWKKDNPGDWYLSKKALEGVKNRNPDDLDSFKNEREYYTQNPEEALVFPLLFKDLRKNKNGEDKSAFKNNDVWEYRRSLENELKSIESKQRVGRDIRLVLWGVAMFATQSFVYSLNNESTPIRPPLLIPIPEPGVNASIPDFGYIASLVNPFINNEGVTQPLNSSEIALLITFLNFISTTLVSWHKYDLSLSEGNIDQSAENLKLHNISAFLSIFNGTLGAMILEFSPGIQADIDSMILKLFNTTSEFTQQMGQDMYEYYKLFLNLFGLE